MNPSIVEKDDNDSNAAAEALAKRVFSDCNEVVVIQLTNGQPAVTLFYILTDLVLFGINLLSQGQVNLYDLKGPDDEMIGLLNTYLKKVGVEIVVKEYEESPDHCVRIYPNYPIFEGWQLLDYKIYTCPSPHEKIEDHVGVFAVNFIKYLYRFNQVNMGTTEDKSE